MDKFVAHCKLSVVRERIEEGKVKATRTALSNAADLGVEFAEMVSIVMALTTDDFYKSMTTYDDHRVWQDVYRPTTRVGEVYLKLTVIDDVLIVSFKEL